MGKKKLNFILAHKVKYQEYKKCNHGKVYNKN